MNKHGLNRRLPSDVARQLRRESGFGCAMCGDGLIEYAHLNPPYEDAVAHDPEKMVVLCPSCHTRIDKKRLPLSMAWAAKENPKALQVGYVSERLEFSTPLSVIFGNNKFTDVSCIVKTIDGDEWFTIEPPEEGDTKPRISVKFFDADGNIDLEIVRNEWRCSSDVWDAEFPANRIIIRHRKNKVVLQLSLEPPQLITLERLDMHLFGSGVRIDAGKRMYLSHGGYTKKFDDNIAHSSNSVFLIPGTLEDVTKGTVIREHQCSLCQKIVELWIRTSEGMHRQCDCGGSLKPILSANNLRSSSTNEKDLSEPVLPKPPTSRLLRLPDAENMVIQDSYFGGYDGIDTTGIGNLSATGNVFNGRRKQLERK